MVANAEILAEAQGCANRDLALDTSHSVAANSCRWTPVISPKALNIYPRRMSSWSCTQQATLKNRLE